MPPLRFFIEPLEARIAPAFAPAIDLGALNGANGFKIVGIADGDDMRSVSDAGDVNGDGFADVIVGAVFADEGGNNRGANYVVFGKAGGFGASLNLSTLDGTNGFKLSGLGDGDLSGRVVGAAGDVNGDGFDDIIVGSRMANEGGNDRGATYVVFGKAASFGPTVDLAALDGSNGFKLSGVADGDRSGGFVNGAGDVNGDGFDDVILSAVYADAGGNERGASYVVFGKAQGFSASLPLSALDGTNGFKLSGVGDNDHAGLFAASAGDVNGDGFDDVILGARSADEGGNNRGAAYIIFGKTRGFPANLDLATLDGTNGFKLSGAVDGDNAGRFVNGAGDVNGDGFDDVIVGAFYAHEGGTARGASYVVFGKPSGFSASLVVSALDGTNGFKLSGVSDNDESGYSVSGAGDVNGDGFDDVIVGAFVANEGGTYRGASYVVFGKPRGFSASVALAGLDGTDGFKLSGLADNDRAGSAVSSAGDVNGDGFDDFIVGAPFADEGGTDRGAAYVIFGSNGGNLVNVNANGHKATFTDVDGDHVTIRIDRGTLTADNFLLTGANALGGATLRLIDFGGDAQFNGATLTITAVRGPTGGDGFVNVGHLDAGGIDLGIVTIKGDLGSITAGDSDGIDPAIKTLTVNSLGLLGLSTQGGLGATLTSHIDGSASKVSVKTNVSGIAFFTSGKLGKLRVGANVADSTIGAGYDPDGAAVNGDARIKKAVILGDWLRSNLVAGVNAGADDQFGTEDDTALGGGMPEVVSKIARLVIGGQVLGSFGDATRYGFVAQSIRSVTIGGTDLPLTANADTLLIGPTFDVALHELA